MFIQQQLTALIATLSITNALSTGLQIRNAAPSAWTWAHDPTNCKTDACLSDCQAATAKVCASSNLGNTNTETVGDCTAFYYYDAGNTVPTANQCNAAYAQLTGPPSKTGSPNDCPGYVGGALGYDSSNKRTNDPVYMVYPSMGNGNCMKAPGDTSPVVALEEIPNSNGQTLPPTCPTATSRRKRAQLTDIEARDVKCHMESFGTAFGCSAACIVEVTAGGWEFGPLVAVGWLACSGVCLGTSIKVAKTCFDAVDGNPNPPKAKRSAAPLDRTHNPCITIPAYDWQCATWEKTVMSVYQCNSDAGELAVEGGTGSNSIQT